MIVITLTFGCNNNNNNEINQLKTQITELENEKIQEEEEREAEEEEGGPQAVLLREPVCEHPVVDDVDRHARFACLTWSTRPACGSTLIWQELCLRLDPNMAGALLAARP